MSDLPSSPVTLTREELYAKVWEAPMSRLAVGFGITGNGLPRYEKRWAKPGEPDTKRAVLPSGKLTFAIKTYLPAGFRQEWLENDETPLEQLLPDIVATFVALVRAR